MGGYLKKKTTTKSQRRGGKRSYLDGVDELLSDRRPRSEARKNSALDSRSQPLSSNTAGIHRPVIVKGSSPFGIRPSNNRLPFDSMVFINNSVTHPKKKKQNKRVGHRCPTTDVCTHRGLQRTRTFPIRFRNGIAMARLERCVSRHLRPFPSSDSRPSIDSNRAKN